MYENYQSLTLKRHDGGILEIIMGASKSLVASFIGLIPQYARRNGRICTAVSSSLQPVRHL